MKDCSNCAHGGALKDVAHCAVTHEIVRLPYCCESWKDGQLEQRVLAEIEREEHHPYPHE